MNRILLGVIAAAVAVLASSCAAKLPVVESLARVDDDEIVVVGRVRLTPPLADGEQRFGEWHVREGVSAKGKPAMLLESNLDAFDAGNFTWLTSETGEAVGDIRAYHYLNVIREPIDSLFFVAVPRKNVHIAQGEIVLEKRTGGYKDKIHLPAGFRLDVREGDRAIYIGTVHYHRNEFLQVLSVDVEDDFESARKQFRERFGSEANLRRALVKRR